jgi:hypothetical protein
MLMALATETPVNRSEVDGRSANVAPRARRTVVEGRRLNQTLVVPDCRRPASSV